MCRTKTVLSVAGLVLLIAQQAVAAPQSARPRKTVGGQVEKTGEVLIVRGLRGGEPQLTDGERRRFLLTGHWRRELLRLGGHQVKVWGQFGKEKLMQKTIEVERYEIIASGNGHRPQVGVLLKRPAGQLQLQQRERTLEVRARPALREVLVKRLGCKVWIVGELRDAVLEASKFGWLSCDADATLKRKKETLR